jgi:hypothetical protein
MPRTGAIAIAALMLAGCYTSTMSDGHSDYTLVDVQELSEPGVDTAPEPAREPEPEEDVPPEPDPEPIPENCVGDPCYWSSECDGVPAGGRVCLTSLMGYVDFPGGYCSAVCTADSECGPDGECKNIMDLGQFCLKRCEASSDCRTPEGYTCSYLPTETGLYCLPPSCCEPDA